MPPKKNVPHPRERGVGEFGCKRVSRRPGLIASPVTQRDDWRGDCGPAGLLSKTFNQVRAGVRCEGAGVRERGERTWRIRFARAKRARGLRAASRPLCIPARSVQKGWVGGTRRAPRRGNRPTRRPPESRNRQARGYGFPGDSGFPRPCGSRDRPPSELGVAGKEGPGTDRVPRSLAQGRRGSALFGWIVPVESVPPRPRLRLCV